MQDGVKGSWAAEGVWGKEAFGLGDDEHAVSWSDNSKHQDIQHTSAQLLLLSLLLFTADNFAAIRTRYRLCAMHFQSTNQTIEY